MVRIVQEANYFLGQEKGDKAEGDNRGNFADDPGSRIRAASFSGAREEDCLRRQASGSETVC